MESNNSNANPVPQIEGTIIDEPTQAVSKGLRTREEEEAGEVEKEFNGQGKIEKIVIPGGVIRLFQKSLFSLKTQQEIENGNFTEKEKLFFQQLKVSRIVDYITGVEFYDQLKKIPFGSLHRFFPTVNDEQYISSVEDHNILKDFFENHKSCTESGSCGSEACPEITALIRCWKGCEADKNLNCPRCCLAVEAALWENGQKNIIRKRKDEPLKKLLELTDNYDGLKVKNDWRKKSLFATCANPDLETNFSEEERNGIKLLKIFRILHSQKCLFRFWVKVCDYPDCESLKEILKHTEYCLDEVTCTNKNCREVKNLISHWEICEPKNTSDCPICGNFPSKYREFLENIQEIQIEIEKELSEFKVNNRLKPIEHENPGKIKIFFSNW